MDLKELLFKRVKTPPVTTETKEERWISWEEYQYRRTMELMDSFLPPSKRKRSRANWESHLAAHLDRVTPSNMYADAELEDDNGGPNCGWSGNTPRDPGEDL